ncbi:unnamed protein product [Rhodiola kirilowii]
MRPKNESLEEFKLKCFKFSLTNFAIDWYYSCAAYEGNYGDLRTKFLEKSCPPSLRLETRKKILNLEQSRDETLDEYLAYFDSIVASCPHHGFTNHYLIQRFLAGMTPLEWKKLNDAAGGSIMKLTMAETWDLIDELAESTKQGPIHQTDDEAPTEDEDSQITEEEPARTGPVLTVEAPNTSPCNLPEEVPDFTAESAKTSPALMAEAPELPENGPILTEKLLKKDLALVVEVPQLVPSVCIRITAPEDKVINEEVQGKLEAGQRQEKPTMEHSLVMSQEKPAENSLVLGWQFISATKKRVSKGACLRSLGKRLNFQNYKDANRPYTKKRQRHGPVQWKPGRKNKRARLIEPAVMVKGPQPSQKLWKEKTPKPWSSYSGKKSGRSNTGTVAKFDLSHPWDPNQ